MANLRVDEKELLEEAEDRFRQANDYFSDAYAHWLEDFKFGHGDAYNGYQWPTALAKSRAIQDQVSLTINTTRQHCLQVVNALTQADAGVSYRAVSDDASQEAAETLEGIARYIQYTSNARSVYGRAVQQQVFGGLGFWRVVTEYRDEKSQDQDIFIRGVKDPTRIYMDPDCNEPDFSDARFAFVFDEIPKKEFERRYPDADKAGKDIFGSIWRGNASEDHVGIVEYFRRVTKRERMYYLESGATVLSSALPTEIRQKLETENVNSRIVEVHSVQWFKICGNQILEKTTWPGTYIPLVPVFGETTEIDGQFDISGHVRHLIDAQRQYNYMRSAATQAIGLQSKTPYVGPMESFSGLETYWENANRANFAWLPYNGYDSQGRPIAPPQRQPAPIMPQAYIAGTEAAAQDMKMVSGQFEASLGEPSNERSGVAIKQRQMAAEQGSDHFKQAFAMALRFTGRILLDLIPKIYTSKRVIMILAEDGKQSRVQIDPQAPQALQEHENAQQNKATAIFNPNVGKYEVEADVGQGFMTQRQQSFDALMAIMTKAPEWAPVIGDLLMKNAPFPTAEEMSERLYRMVPPQALGGPSPQLIQMQAQLADMRAKMADLVQDAADKQLRGQTEQQQKEIDAYKAETDRMETLKAIDPTAIQPLVEQLVHQALQGILGQQAPAVHVSPAGLADFGPQPVAANTSAIQRLNGVLTNE